MRQDEELSPSNQASVPEPSAPGRPEPALTTRALAELGGLDRLGRQAGSDDKLGDPVAGLDPEHLGGIIVEQQHLDFPAVAGINQPGGVNK